jgi:hypothetical protein
VTTNGPANEATPIARDAPKRSRRSSGSIEEGQKDRTEGGEEGQPLGVGVEVEEVADDHPEAELDQRDREPKLDRDHAGDDNDCGEDCG